MALPILVALMVGVVEISDALNAYTSVVAASRDGARLGSRGGADDAEVRALVITNLSRLRNTTTTGDITVTHNTVAGDQSILVQVCHRRTLIMNYPLLPLPNPMTMCATSTMRKLVLPS